MVSPTLNFDCRPAPACRDQLVLRHDGAGVRREVQQNAKVAVAERNTFAVTTQAAGAPIELEGTERVDDARRHVPDCTGWRGRKWPVATGVSARGSFGVVNVLSNAAVFRSARLRLGFGRMSRADARRTDPRRAFEGRRSSALTLKQRE